MKIFLTIVACMGLALVLLAVVPASLITIDFLREPAGFGYHSFSFAIYYPLFWAWYPAMFGAVVALIGGLIARPRFLWIPLVAIGVLHLIASTGFYVYIFRAPDVTRPVMRTLVTVIPGLLCVVEGLVIRRFTGHGAA